MKLVAYKNIYNIYIKIKMQEEEEEKFLTKQWKKNIY